MNDEAQKNWSVAGIILACAAALIGAWLAIAYCFRASSQQEIDAAKAGVVYDKQQFGRYTPVQK